MYVNSIHFLNFLHTVYCKSFKVEKLCGFMDRSVTVKLSSEIACAIGFGHTRLLSNHKCFPANFSKLQFSFAAAKLFHLKQFAVYIFGIVCKQALMNVGYVHLILDQLAAVDKGSHFLQKNPSQNFLAMALI